MFRDHENSLGERLGTKNLYSRKLVPKQVEKIAEKDNLHSIIEKELKI
jgi:hypothetical protein